MKTIFFYIFFLIDLAWSEFSSIQNQILCDNKEYNIRGINWFGIQTDCGCPHGLWVHDTLYYLDTVRNLGFNSLRIPFSYEIAMNLDSPLKHECITADPFVSDFSTRKYIHHLFYHAGIRNMTILLDFHTTKGEITQGPYDYINETLFLRSWDNILREYGNYKNLIGIDIKNEPHGYMDWNQWAGVVNRFMNHVQTTFPTFDKLFFVEGIEIPEDGSTWGESFSKMNTLFTVNPSHKIVFSPHVYGVSVRGLSALLENASVWEKWFGFLYKYFDNSICIGEIGGWNGGPDYAWHQNILNYLSHKNINNFYYWSLNPDSQDTGGLLMIDWTTLDKDKITFCSNLQKNPTFLDFGFSKK